MFTATVSQLWTFCIHRWGRNPLLNYWIRSRLAFPVEKAQSFQCFHQMENYRVTATMNDIHRLYNLTRVISTELYLQLFCHNVPVSHRFCYLWKESSSWDVPIRNTSLNGRHRRKSKKKNARDLSRRARQVEADRFDFLEGIPMNTSKDYPTYWIMIYFYMIVRLFKHNKRNKWNSPSRSATRLYTAIYTRYVKQLIGFPIYIRFS